MPTGSGKTAVLMLIPYLIRKQRVLVVTPSKMVRGQIAEDFTELRTLCVANVFNTSIKKPKVFEMEHLYTNEYQKDLEQADVIVATPSCAISLSESDWAKENIDLVEVVDCLLLLLKVTQDLNRAPFVFLFEQYVLINRHPSRR